MCRPTRIEPAIGFPYVGMAREQVQDLARAKILEGRKPIKRQASLLLRLHQTRILYPRAAVTALIALAQK
jgi:hypothetical protein